ncbi:DUF975 family protein [Aureibacter tunicatorum]|uniref:Membrane protein n=1 Tax=Aureibacter tunicatorum TaxID=866807 RepID=A0AAE3XRG6_9BACT|nr:DUF975 family protein [Aureibacter tunicatorum]MDR6240570.1 putative membrane protein [Aureibacter tunicatorum]BDD06569.1 membrane protein [Aureibacter tunicatorum]
MSITSIFDETKQAMQGKWGLAIGAFVVFLLITFGMQMVPFIGSLASIILSGPLSVGLCVFYLALVRNDELKLELLFEGFNKFKESLLTYLAIFAIAIVFLAIMGTVLFITGASSVFSLFSNLDSAQPDAILNLMTSGAFSGSLLVTFILATIFQLHVSQAYYLVAEENLSGFQALKESSRIMNGYKLKLFGLFLIMGIAGTILTIITFGLGLLLVAPFSLSALAIFYDKINPKNEFAEVIA